MSRKFVYHNCNLKSKADVVILGVPDESGNLANRSGASKGPGAIRKASHDRLSFKREGKTKTILPERGTINFKIHDLGDVKKRDIAKIVSKLKHSQIPVTLGGDHSITSKVFEGLSKNHKKIGVVYFDAHPDIVSSKRDYYGSVITDICRLPSVNSKKIVEIGLRSIEEEEEVNLRKNKITYFTSLDVAEVGIRKVFATIKKKMRSMPVYISIDLDSIDPAFAPAVDTPSPFGLLPNDFLYLVKRCASELNVIGFDIMELSPKHDIQQRTAHLAAQTIIEIVGSM